MRIITNDADHEWLGFEVRNPNSNKKRNSAAYQKHPKHSKPGFGCFTLNESSHSSIITCAKLFQVPSLLPRYASPHLSQRRVSKAKGTSRRPVDLALSYQYASSGSFQEGPSYPCLFVLIACVCVLCRVCSFHVCLYLKHG
jgi:hypothetical protein